MSTKQIRPTYPPAPGETNEPEGIRFYCFRLGFPTDMAEKIFVRRFGQPPEQSIQWKSFYYLGPIPEERTPA